MTKEGYIFFPFKFVFNQNVNNSIVLNYNYMDIQHNLIKDELTQKESRLNDEPGCQTVGKSNSFYMI